MPYSRLLRNYNWQMLRLKALEASGGKCQRCGRLHAFLNVHHKKYRDGAKPWEYELDELEVLCEECHHTHHILAAQPDPEPRELTPLELEILAAIEATTEAERLGDWARVHELLTEGMCLIRRKLGIGPSVREAA